MEDDEIEAKRPFKNVPNTYTASKGQKKNQQKSKNLREGKLCSPYSLPPLSSPQPYSSAPWDHACQWPQAQYSQ